MLGSIVRRHSVGRSDGSLSLLERAAVCRVVNTIDDAASGVTTAGASRADAEFLLKRYRADLLGRLQRHLEGSLLSMLSPGQAATDL